MWVGVVGGLGREVGGWVGGWVSRGDKGGSKEVLESMGGWVGGGRSCVLRRWVGGWVGGKRRRDVPVLVEGGVDPSSSSSSSSSSSQLPTLGKGVATAAHGKGRVGGWVAFLLLLLFLFLLPPTSSSFFLFLHPIVGEGGVVEGGWVGGVLEA